MNRPYRDDEERQVKKVVKDLMNCANGVREGYLDFARTALWMACDSFEVLESMVTAFDEDEAREAEDERSR